MIKTKYLNNLTPMRGIAALLVVIFHFDLMMGNGGDFLIKKVSSLFLTRMYLMVDFFFILSGFIMCHVYGKIFSSTVSKESFKRFIIARFARVYPLHIFTLFYCILLFFISAQLGIPSVPVLQIANNGSSILTNVFLLQSMNLHNWFSWDHASWSISVEWWAYMVFPFLVAPIFAMGKAKKILITIGCFLGYLAITFLIVPMVTIPKEIPFVKVNPDQLSINVAYQYGYIRCLCGFILGMMVYQAYTSGWLLKLLSNGFVLLGLTLLVFISMHFALPDVITVIPFPLILLSGAYGNNRMDHFFGHTIFQNIGNWSFSIYLIHEPLLYTLGNIMAFLNPINPNNLNAPPPPNPSIPLAWIYCCLFIIVTLALSFLTYRYLEVPSRKWLNRKQVSN